MTTVTRTQNPFAPGRLLIAVGNEVRKGLLHGWAERLQILMELGLFVTFFLLVAAVLGQGEQITQGRLDWSFDPQRVTFLFVGFAAFQFFYLQAQKMFWRLLGEIQTGTLEQVYLSPLPSWVIAAAGRVTAIVAETAVITAVLYVVTSLVTDLQVRWAADALVPIVFLIIGSVGYSLIIGALTQLWKRIELLNDGLLVLVMFVSGALVPIDWTPAGWAAVGRLLPITHPIVALRTVLIDGNPLAATGDGGLLWMVSVAAAWLVVGAVAFHIGDTTTRRNGTIIRT